MSRLARVGRIRETLCLLSLLNVLIVGGSAARAAQSESERVRTFGQLPDWTGIWENVEARQAFIDEFARHDPSSDPAAGLQALFRSFKLMGHPPYTPEWENSYRARLRDVAALAKTAANGKSCTLPGFPFAMEWASLFQVIIVPEQTLFVFDSGAVRHVRTSGQSHPPPGDLWPTEMGDSVGHWEGTTLVIDTIERTPGPIGFGQGPELSERAHFTEHLRMLDADTLEDRMTIEDPLRFTRLWEVSLRYRRVKNLDRLIATGCEHDRNPVVHGHLVIAPP